MQQNEKEAIAKDIRVFVGSTHMDKGQEYKVKEMTFHPKRAFTPNAYDIVLFELEETLQLSENVQPICLPDVAPSPGIKVLASGWGATHPTKWERSPKNLMFVWLTVIPLKEGAELCFYQQNFRQGMDTLNESPISSVISNFRIATKAHSNESLLASTNKYNSV